MNPIIANAIGRGWHNTGDEKLTCQTWESFDKAVKGKKLFLFGVGDGLEYFYDSYGKQYDIEGVIDNDKRKQGVPIEEYVTIQENTMDRIIKISGISMLRKYDYDTVVVLITSLRYYREIGQQLEQEGILDYFALLPMEANRDSTGNHEDDNITGYLEDYYRLPIDDKKIVFYSMGSYSGHGKAIAEALLNFRQDLDIVWAVDSLAVDVPKGIRLVYRRNKRKYLYEMSTAKVWVDEHIVPRYLKKRSEQLYIQAKHWSSITLKSFGLKLYGFRKDKSDIEAYSHNSDMIDYIFVGSKFDEETCREGFGFMGQAVHVGSPRSDILFRQERCKENVFQYYNLDPKCRYLLYAPTFRYKKNSSDLCEVYCDLDFERLTKILEHKFGCKWKVLLRLHPLLAVEQYNMELSENVIAVSDYDDSQELVAAADMLITDYSSIMFEPAFIGKPVFLYAPDRKEFIDGERELLIDYDTLPFPIAETNDELMERIKAFDAAEHKKTVQKFLDSYGVQEDGHAAERAAEFISGLIPEKEKNETQIG